MVVRNESKQSSTLWQQFIGKFVNMASRKKKLKFSDSTQQTLVFHAGSMSCAPVTVQPIDSANDEAQKNVDENNNNLTGPDMKSPKVVRKWNDK